ncbi:hypothetical protein REPUB_Repub09cG0033700 [Reevesia pubescens]
MGDYCFVIRFYSYDHGMVYLSMVQDTFWLMLFHQKRADSILMHMRIGVLVIVLDRIRWKLQNITIIAISQFSSAYFLEKQLDCQQLLKDVFPCFYMVSNKETTDSITFGVGECTRENSLVLIVDSTIKKFDSAEQFERFMNSEMKYM